MFSLPLYILSAAVPAEKPKRPLGRIGHNWRVLKTQFSVSFIGMVPFTAISGRVPLCAQQNQEKPMKCVAEVFFLLLWGPHKFWVRHEELKEKNSKPSSFHLCWDDIKRSVSYYQSLVCMTRSLLTSHPISTERCANPWMVQKSQWEQEKEEKSHTFWVNKGSTCLLLLNTMQHFHTLVFSDF